jgi:predicted nucleic acid-binding protein
VRLSTLVACLLLSAAPAGAAEWVRVETPNFIVYGEPGERRVREIADEFERFRDALARVIPGAGTPAAVPTVVVVFGSARSFEPYRPRFNGKPIKLGGYFFASDDMNIVALVDADRDESLRTIFHEYVHLVIDNVSQGMPLWLNEGLAEYYSTFQVEDSGRRALVGRAIPSHLQLLNERRLLTIPELLAVDSSSLADNEGERQSLFYAQSWALVHMLVSGATNGSSLLSQYAQLASDGMPSLDAWQQTFKDQNITRQLESYVRQDVMKAVIYRFSERIPQVKSYSSGVSEGDVQAVQGDLLRRVAAPAETAARFEKAIALLPRSARARALYALLLLDLPHGGDETPRARGLLLEAATDTSDWLVQYHVATGLTRIATTADERDPLGIATARAALKRVLAARPDLANAHALGARLDAEEDDDVPRSLDAIRRARNVSPGRSDYILLEAFILMRRGDYVAARQLLTPLTAPRYSPQVRDNAAAVVEQVTRLEREAAAYRAGLEGQRDTQAAGAEKSRLVPLYRRVEPGERRVQGLLERIDCTATGIVLQVNVEGTIERFAAPTMNGVTFISHREDLRGGLECAVRTPPDRVYVTWREDDPPAGARRVVAVEFLPKPR